RAKTILRRPRTRLSLEELETRLAPATHTWTGSDGTGLWSHAANWSGGAPSASTPGDDLMFPQGVVAANRSTKNDVVGLSVTQITIADSGYTLAPANANDGITLANSLANPAILVNNGALNATISLPMALGSAAASSVSITVGSTASLTLSGNLSGNSAT